MPLGDEEVEEETADLGGLHGGKYRPARLRGYRRAADRQRISRRRPTVPPRVAASPTTSRDQLGDVPSGEPAPGQVGQHPPALDRPRQVAELGGALGGERQRHRGAIAPLGPLGGERAVDERALDAHGQQIAREPRRPAPAGRAGLRRSAGRRPRRRAGRARRRAPARPPPPAAGDPSGAAGGRDRPARTSGARAPGAASGTRPPRRRRRRAAPAARRRPCRPTASPAASASSAGTDAEPDAVDLDPDACRGGADPARGAVRTGRAHSSSSAAVAGAGAHAGVHAEQLLHLALDLGHERRVVAQEQLGVLPALADALIAVGVPGARLLDDVRPRRRGPPAARCG